MTRLLREAVAAVSALPDGVQDELATILLQMAGGRAAAEVRAMWTKHGL